MSTKNKAYFDELLHQLQKMEDKMAVGGGAKALTRLKEKGKMSARERIAALLDPGTASVEIGALAGWGMYEEEGGCPSGGVVVVLGYIHGRLVVVVANDATVKAGAWFPITGKKNLRAQEIAMENRLPIIYLVDSAGIYLPLQNEIFADKEHFGRIFRNNARMSSMGIVQIAAVMGSCVAGGAYLPIMSDEALIVEESGSIFLAGSYLVKAAIGEEVDNEKLGGASTHCEISGVTDHKMPNDSACLERIRLLVSQLAEPQRAGFDRIPSVDPARPATELYELFPAGNARPYDVLPLLECLVDQGSMVPYKELYGQSICCVYARVDGWAVGIVANQRKVVKNAQGEMQFGGVIYSDSADKATRFIANCNQRRIPLVFLQDVTGFMVGSRSEHGGIIKDGAKMVNAVANSVVPKFTIITGHSYGAGNYAMCGKAYDPRLIVAWPSAEIAVMGGEQASKVLLQIQTSAAKAAGKAMDPATEQSLLKDIQANYKAQTHPQYAAARLWVDGIIDPVRTRQVISIGIEAANHAPITDSFNMGVLQV
ncbi:MAG: acyl-CoA carboxylase subunit beta [Sphingomonadales bacterium]|nr:acyl-CoA carboxylase subunit beta [Sphingomonadales bacterium]